MVMYETRKYPYVNDLEKKRDSLILKMYKGEMTLGEFVKGIRDLNGMTQAQFAKFTKLSRQTIINIEQDKGNCSLNTINRVLKMGGLKLGIAPPPKVAKYWANAIEKSFSE